MDLSRLKALLDELGEPAFRLRQVHHAYAREYAGSWDEISTLPKKLRETLSERIPFSTITIDDRQDSADGTIKLRLHGNIEALQYEQMTDKQRAAIESGPYEAVLMEFNDGRQTACLSSQSGCALACTFCATGTMGFGRNLTRWEILDQFLTLNRFAHKRGGKIDNVVMMGMGEPFHNYDEVIAALRMLNDPDLCGLGARRIAISTAGWIPGIKKLADEPQQFKLALSLHAPNDELRTQLMPVTKKFPIADLMAACRSYREKTNRRIFVEYLMLDGVNDTGEIGNELADLLIGGGFHVNLIAYNPTGSPYKGSSAKRVEAFGRQLEKRGLSTTYRISRGQDIDAACGQLVVDS